MRRRRWLLPAWSMDGWLWWISRASLRRYRSRSSDRAHPPLKKLTKLPARISPPLFPFSNSTFVTPVSKKAILSIRVLQRSVDTWACSPIETAFWIGYFSLLNREERARHNTFRVEANTEAKWCTLAEPCLLLFSAFISRTLSRSCTYRQNLCLLLSQAAAYLEQPQDVGYHDGDHAECRTYHTGHRLMGNVCGHLTVLALVLRYVLKQRRKMNTAHGHLAFWCDAIGAQWLLLSNRFSRLSLRKSWTESERNSHEDAISSCAPRRFICNSYPPIPKTRIPRTLYLPFIWSGVSRIYLYINKQYMHLL